MFLNTLTTAVDLGAAVGIIGLFGPYSATLSRLRARGAFAMGSPRKALFANEDVRREWDALQKSELVVKIWERLAGFEAELWEPPVAPGHRIRVSYAINDDPHTIQLEIERPNIHTLVIVSIQEGQQST